MGDIRKRRSNKGISYQVRFVDPTTKSGHAYRSFDTWKAAQAFKAERELEEARLTGSSAARSGGLSPTGPSIRTVPEAIDHWLRICGETGTSRTDQPVTAYTLKGYGQRAEIMKGYGWAVPLQALTTPDIVAFKAWLLARAASRDQARKVLSSFQTVMKEMALRGVIASNVAAGVSIRAETRYDAGPQIPTEREVMDLLAAADRLANSKNAQIADAWQRYRVMLYYAADTGMRPQEYLAVPQFNIRPKGTEVDRAIQRPGHRISVTKTQAGRRFLPGSADVLEMVRHYAAIHAVPNAHDLVFPTSTGRWQSIDNWRKRGFAKACEEAGLMLDDAGRDLGDATPAQTGAGTARVRPKFTPYALRHFSASMLIDRGLSLKRIQTRMGHSAIETTLNTYGHLIERAESAEAEEAGMLGLIEG